MCVLLFFSTHILTFFCCPTLVWTTGRIRGGRFLVLEACLFDFKSGGHFRLESLTKMQRWAGRTASKRHHEESANSYVCLTRLTLTWRLALSWGFRIDVLALTTPKWILHSPQNLPKPNRVFNKRQIIKSNAGANVGKNKTVWGKK